MNKENEPFIITVIQDLANATSLVNSFFKDEAKTQTWMNSANPLLGNKEPAQMIFEGRTEKLIKFIRDRLEANEL